MNLDADALFGDHEPPEGAVLQGAALARAYWRLRHMREEAARKERYWASVCDALTGAYDELDVKTNELQAVRVELLRAKEGLEERVEEQVRALRRHAERIDRMNDHLQAKVHDRSRELLALAQTLPRADLRPGAILGTTTRIEEPLGEGGTGVVYRATDPTFGGAIAVKLLRRPGHPGATERFLREAVSATRITHPSVVRTLHVDLTAHGMPYLVMELVRGRSLRSLVADRGPLAPPVVARLGAELAGALGAAHRASVIHRDVKPANVMITTDEPGLRVLDFGLSKLFGEGAADDLTLEGRLVGTPMYMAPEQIRDPSRAGPEVDVYSTGATLFELVAGRPPFVGASIEALSYAHLHEDPPVLAGAPPPLAELIDASLAKHPRDRPAITEIERSLNALASELGARSARDEAQGLLCPTTTVTIDETPHDSG